MLNIYGGDQIQNDDAAVQFRYSYYDKLLGVCDDVCASDASWRIVYGEVDLTYLSYVFYSCQV